MELLEKICITSFIFGLISFACIVSVSNGYIDRMSKLESFAWLAVFGGSWVTLVGTFLTIIWMQ